jgi:uncharacterized protein (DUF2235 family)
MTTRLILCFDGTWNRPDPVTGFETNVCRFYEAVPVGAVTDGATQQKWYEPGVGTNWYDRVAGGAFGLGIDQKIQEGYRWLADNYPEPDRGDIEVYIVGFSRGAYTARSLVGLIRNSGLLLPENTHRVRDAYAMYRQRDESPDTTQAEAFRSRYSREIKIHFLGVWDTVGALGVPIQALEWLNAKEYGFHDTELSGIVRNAAHALAVDEHRVDYQATLWEPKVKPEQNVEQRWFIGAHADVGGGYEARLLSDITLAWMQQRASATGLVIDNTTIPVPDDANWKHGPTDSYGQFLHGVYAKTHPRFLRTMQLGTGLNEVLDDTVMHRCGVDATYKPINPGFTLPPVVTRGQP